MFFWKNNKGKQFKFKNEQTNQSAQDFKPLLFSLEENIAYICETLNNTEDLKLRDVSFRGKQGKLVYLETMTDPKEIERSFFIPLTQASEDEPLENIITNIDLKISKNLNEVISEVLLSGCAFLIDGKEETFLFKTPIENERSPEEPDSEKIVHGSHTGLVESIDININLIRRQIVNTQFMVKYYEVGQKTHTNIALIYMNQIANPSMIAEVEKRILSISSDMNLTPGFIEEFIEDDSFSPFPQLMYTERPDRVKAQLMEGRVAIISEGSAAAIILPVTFFSFFQSPDDYSVRFYTASIFRLLRLFSFFGTLFFPALYIAVVAFHFEVVPFKMVTLVKDSIETIPYPPFFEAILMAITIELIREAGIRLPTSIGQTIGIVGGLIIGEAIVNAGLVSNVMVIIIALTAIMSFTLPSYEMGNTVRILTFPIMVAAATLGFVGIVISFMFIVVHMCKLQSFGTPYLSPIAPVHLQGLKDALFRFPIWTLKKRPEELHPQQKIQQGSSREWKQSDK